jgi:hypothetical protein
VVGPSGKVIGNIIKLKSIVVEGIVMGNLNAETITLRGNASVQGDVSSQQVFIDPTVSLQGKLLISSDPPYPEIDKNGYITNFDTFSDNIVDVGVPADQAVLTGNKDNPHKSHDKVMDNSDEAFPAENPNEVHEGRENYSEKTVAEETCTQPPELKQSLNETNNNQPDDDGDKEIEGIIDDRQRPVEEEKLVSDDKENMAKDQKENDVDSKQFSGSADVEGATIDDQKLITADADAESVTAPGDEKLADSKENVDDAKLDVPGVMDTVVAKDVMTSQGEKPEDTQEVEVADDAKLTDNAAAVDEKLADDHKDIESVPAADLFQDDYKPNHDGDSIDDDANHVDTSKLVDQPRATHSPTGSTEVHADAIESSAGEELQPIETHPEAVDSRSIDDDNEPNNFISASDDVISMPCNETVDGSSFRPMEAQNQALSEESISSTMEGIVSKEHESETVVEAATALSSTAVAESDFPIAATESSEEAISQPELSQS